MLLYVNKLNGENELKTTQKICVLEYLIENACLRMENRNSCADEYLMKIMRGLI
jgi:hypothetical protein